MPWIDEIDEERVVHRDIGPETRRRNSAVYGAELNTKSIADLLKSPPGLHVIPHCTLFAALREPDRLDLTTLREVPPGDDSDLEGCSDEELPIGRGWSKDI